MNLPPGVTQRQLDGQPCPNCGLRGCDCCDPDTQLDELSYRERIELDKGEEQMERERADD